MPAGLAAIASRFLRPVSRNCASVSRNDRETNTRESAYQTAIQGFFDGAAIAIAAHLNAGRSVAVIQKGDPLFLRSSHASSHALDAAATPLT